MKRFHVSCCGRSGSKYLALALNTMGISTLHEMGNDWPFEQSKGIKFFAENPALFTNYRGIVGWKWSILTPKYAERFPVQFHMVRHPLSAIESATTHADSLFNQVENALGKPDFISSNDENVIRLGRAINYWINYNQKFAKDKTIFCVEEFKNGTKTVDNFLNMIEAPTNPSALLESLSTNVNSRPNATKRVGCSWELINKHYPSQKKVLIEMAEKYGYSE